MEFFKSDFIIVRNITRRIAESACELVWDEGIAPKDALHVATALDAKLHLLSTFDRQLIGHSKQDDLGAPEIFNPSYVEPRIPEL